MVGVVGHFTLQPMARTNHKFPGFGGPGHSKGSEIDSTYTLVSTKDKMTGPKTKSVLM